jgi:tetratricopeptide (TPR) repeat protein
MAKDKIKQKSVKQKAAYNNAKAPQKKNNTFLWMSIAAIVITASFIYSNSFNCSFHFDDLQNIEFNPDITRLSDVSAWWNYVPSRPIGIFTFALNYAMGGTNVGGYHFVNLLIHIFNGLLVFWVVSLLFETPVIKKSAIAKHGKIIALITALLFVAHPVQTQAVTYIVQRLASLAALFFLLSVSLYIRARVVKLSKTARIATFVACGMAALLAFLTKENTFTLPVIIVLTEFFFIRETSFKIHIKDWKLWAFLGMAAVAVTFFFVNFSFTVFQPIKPEQGNIYTLTSGTYLLTEFRVITTYIRLLILPINQNLDYDYPVSQSFFELKTIASFLLLIAILALAVVLYKKHRLASFGVFWFFITLSIESSIIPVPNVIFEHRMYLPSFGFLLFVPCVFFGIVQEKQKQLLTILLFMLVPVLAIAAYSRNNVWKDELTLWTDVIKKSPEKPRVLNNMGITLLKLGRQQEAISWFDKAIAKNPGYKDPYLSRGNAKQDLGDLQGALLDYSAALKIDPSYPETYYNRGYTYAMMKDLPNAIRDFDMAIKLNPDFAKAYLNRSSALAAQKDFNGALSDLDKSIALEPDNALAFCNRGLVHFNLKNQTEACNDWQHASLMGNEQATTLLNAFCGKK